MRKILLALVASLMLLSICAKAQAGFQYGDGDYNPPFMQSVERTRQNPQIHKQDIQQRITNSIINAALNTPYVKPEYKAYDFTGRFADRDMEKIRQKVETVKQKSGIDAAVVFFEASNWSDYDNEEFCKDFYDYNDFGVGDTHDGVCIAINLATHRFAIFDTGKPQTHAIAGSNLQRYTSILQPYFRSDDYAGGVCAFVSAFEADYISMLEYEQLPFYKKDEFYIMVGISLVISLIITITRALRTTKVQKAELATNYERPNSFRLTVNNTTLVSTHTTKTYIPPQSSSGGSSSGTSHSGGSGGW